MLYIHTNTNHRNSNQMFLIKHCEIIPCASGFGLRNLISNIKSQIRGSRQSIGKETFPEIGVNIQSLLRAFVLMPVILHYISENAQYDCRIDAIPFWLVLASLELSFLLFCKTWTVVLTLDKQKDVNIFGSTRVCPNRASPFYI